MSGVNKAILVGNLGRDPEITYLDSGTPVANFSIATNESWRDKQGEKQERTEWHRIVVFGKLAEVCHKYLTKGKLVCIEGRIQTRKWEDRDGAERSTTEIVAREMTMLDRKGDGEGRKRDEPPPPSDDDDNIPF